MGSSVENLGVEGDGLVVALGVHQDAGVLEAGVGLESAAVVGEWQRQRLGQDALRIGGAILGLIDGGQCAQILGILVERGLDLGGKTRGDGECLVVLIVAGVGEEETAPGVERSGLDFEKLLVDVGRSGDTAAAWCRGRRGR